MRARGGAAAPESAQWAPCTVLGVPPTVPLNPAAVAAAAGFPLLPLESGLAGLFLEHRGQGMSGGDFACPGSAAPGACALDGPPAAALLLCLSMAPTCRAAVVFLNGTSGCQPQPTTVLKSAGHSPETRRAAGGAAPGPGLA